MIYSSKISPQGKRALRTLQKTFSWNDDQLDYLIACMAFESNLNPKAVNSVSKAVGLIQFMPSICKAYGTTSEEMLARSFEEQIPYIIKHFLPYYKRTKTLSDMYMAILMPKYIGKPEDTPIFSILDTPTQYRQNKGLDLNKNGVITKKEASSMVYSRYQKGLLDVSEDSPFGEVKERR